jgi:hypothetical protein
VGRGVTHVGWVDGLEVVGDSRADGGDFGLALESVVELSFGVDVLPYRVVEVFGE